MGRCGEVHREVDLCGMHPGQRCHGGLWSRACPTHGYHVRLPSTAAVCLSTALRTIGSYVVGRSVPSHLIFDKGSLRLLPEWKTRAHEGKYGSAGRLPAAPAAQSLLPTGAGRCASSLQAPQSADGYADELDDPELVVAVMRVELQVRKLGLLATVLILFGLST